MRAVGRSVVRLPGPWFLHGCDRRVAYIKQETQVWITLSLFNHCGCDDHNSGRGLKALQCSNTPVHGDVVSLN